MLPSVPVLRAISLLRPILTCRLDPKFPGAKKPYQKTCHRAGWDLTLPETIKLDGYKVTKVDLGIRLEIPRGHYGLLTGRSSFCLHKDASVVDGIIDSDYKDNIFVMIRTYGILEPLTLEKGSRICQIIIQPYSNNIMWFKI